MKIDLQVVTPDKLAFKGDADKISLPTDNGQITILPKHISLVSTIKHGKLSIVSGGEEISMLVYGGFVEVKNNRVRVMTEIAERADEIDEEKAEKAKQEAQRLLKEKANLDDVAFANATVMLEKSILELKAVKRRKHN